MKRHKRYTNRITSSATRPKPKLVKLREEFHRIIKELAIKEDRDIGECIEWLCKDGLRYREEHKNDPPFMKS